MSIIWRMQFGGGWYDRSARITYKFLDYSDWPDRRYYGIGFRIIRKRHAQP